MRRTTPTYPAKLMANIAEAKPGAVNHYFLADRLLVCAKSDMNRATREGELLIAGCRCGTVIVRRTATRGFYTIHRQPTVAEVLANISPAPLFEGTKADAVLYLSTLYTIYA
jgi:hypothetical protein